MAHIVVLGGGVIGLQSAVYLLKAGYQVTIVAAHLPGDQSIEYTSPWAGAHWRTHAAEDDHEQRAWDIETYNEWLEMLEHEQNDQHSPRSGLRTYTSLHYWDSEPQESLWWAPYVQNFRSIPSIYEPIISINKSTPGPAIAAGAAFKAIAVNVPQYLLYLLHRANGLGAKVLQIRIPTEQGLDTALAFVADKIRAADRPATDCFVNATGLGAAKLCRDKAMYPVRGQTVLVKGEAEAIRTRVGKDYIAYCIPRPGAGTSILGGTKDADVWDERVDEETTRSILDRCKVVAPELLTGPDGGFEVVSVQVGLRPARRGGARMEVEVVGDRKVVHAYGHSGAGYQNSVGAARKVVRLAGEALRSKLQARL